VAAYGLVNVDDEYTLYYDETNNIRRLHVRANGFNISEPAIFVLGGIGHLGRPKPLDVSGLKAAVRLQSTAVELKLEHLAKGGFLDVLGSHKLGTYLDWLWAENLLIHYQMLDPLYWSTVDIVDSILTDESVSHMQVYHSVLKNDLFEVMRSDQQSIADFYYRYDYPNVGPLRRAAFITELREWTQARRDILPDFNFQMLKGVLDIGARIATLTYLEDEQPNTLIDSFVMFFVERFSMFKNATHILDVERFIQRRLAEIPLLDNGAPLANYRFVDSKAEPGVQVSDPLVGLLGKFLTYITRADGVTLRRDRSALNAMQRANLARLNGLMDRANAQSPALLHSVLSMTDIRRSGQFLEGA
jgi:hypothetical protein